jgi:multiple antibiotic resistance protein
MEFELDAFIRSTTLLLVLPNLFLMSIYLLDLIERLDEQELLATVTRGALIATTVFCLFASGGDAIFSDVFQLRFDRS